MSTQQQTIKPLNIEKSDIIDLEFCQWRYSRDAVNAYNQYYKEKGSTKRIPEYLTQWQKSKLVLN